jgi:hypothetical protein
MLPPPEPFVYLRDVFPDLVRSLRDWLRRIGERALAESIRELRIYGRCCDAPLCGTFYCLPLDERRRLHRMGRVRNIGMEILATKDQIVEVMTCLPEVDAVLREIFPEPEKSPGE